VSRVNASSIEYVKVGSLKPNLRDLNLIVKIVNIGPSRAVSPGMQRREHLIADAFAGDETGSVILTLWDDQIGRFKPSDVVRIRDGYTTLFKGSLRLNIGRTGRAEKTDMKIEVNTRNNLSEMTHIQIPWHLSESQPFRRRKRR